MKPIFHKCLDSFCFAFLLPQQMTSWSFCYLVCLSAGLCKKQSQSPPAIIWTNWPLGDHRFCVFIYWMCLWCKKYWRDFIIGANPNRGNPKLCFHCCYLCETRHCLTFLQISHGRFWWEKNLTNLRFWYPWLCALCCGSNLNVVIGR